METSQSELLPLFRKPRRRTRVLTTSESFIFFSFLYFSVMPNALNLFSRLCAYLFACPNAWFDDSTLPTCTLYGANMQPFMSFVLKLEEITVTTGLIATVVLYVPVIVMLVFTWCTSSLSKTRN